MNNVVLSEELSQISRLFIYAAMAIYTFAFLADALNLARTASEKKDVRSRAGISERAGLVFLISATVLLAITWPKSRSDVFTSDRRGTMVVRMVLVVDWANAQGAAASVRLAAKAQAVWDQTRFITPWDSAKAVTCASP